MQTELQKTERELKIKTYRSKTIKSYLYGLREYFAGVWGPSVPTLWVWALRAQPCQGGGAPFEPPKLGVPPRE